MAEELEVIATKRVPILPIEQQFYNDRIDGSNLVDARTIMKWLSTSSPRPTGCKLYKYLALLGLRYPTWMTEYIPNIDHVPPMGVIACVTYRLMVEKFDDSKVS